MNFIADMFNRYIALMKTFMGFLIFALIAGIVLVVISVVMKKSGKTGQPFKGIGMVVSVLAAIPLLFIIGNAVYGKFNHASSFKADSMSGKIAEAVQNKDAAQLSKLFTGVDEEEAQEFLDCIEGDVKKLDQPSTELTNDYGGKSILQVVKCDGVIENIIADDGDRPYKIVYKADVYSREGKEQINEMTIYDYKDIPIFSLESSGAS